MPPQIKFNPDLTELVPRSQLFASLGGEYPYEFEPTAYWTQLLANAGIAPDGTRVHDDAFGSPRSDSDASTLNEPEQAGSAPVAKTVVADADRLTPISAPTAPIAS